LGKISFFMKNILFFFCTFLVHFLASSPINAQAKQAKLLGIWHDSTLQTSYYNVYSDIFGYAAKGREYGIIGSTFGTHIIDVTNPKKPKELARIKGGESSNLVIHRDYDTYKTYLYAVCDEGASTLQIIDLSHLPDSVKVVYDSKQFFSRCHNTYIDTAKARLYTLGHGNGQSPRAMRVFDLTNPISPKQVGGMDSIGGFFLDYVHDAFVRNDTAYLNCGYQGLAIADFKNPAKPKLLGTLTQYPNSGYNHSGYLTDDGAYYVMADENWGKPEKLVDVRDLKDLKVVSTFNAESSSTQIPHNPLIKGNLVYTAYYYDGLQVHDISNPAQPKRVAYYDSCTVPDGNGYSGAWGVYPFLPSGNIIFADMQRGMYIVEGINKNALPEENKSIETTHLSVFPQPAEDVLTIEWNSENTVSETRFSLYTMDGKLVATQTLMPSSVGTTSFSFDIKKINTGMYILQAANNGFNVTKKVMVQK
jgi:choice-of-anchor B domain-containing protein